MKNVSVTTWLMKSSDEQCSGMQVILRQGGENISSILCLGHEVMEDFPSFLPSFSSSPYGKKRSSFSSLFSPHVDKKGFNDY
jgi:hypothetical protein